MKVEKILSAALIMMSMISNVFADGNGLPCASCKGAGSIACEHCNGVGKVKRGSQSGSNENIGDVVGNLVGGVFDLSVGIIEGVLTLDPAAIDRNAMVVCRYCNGSGKFVCGNCGGNGCVKTKLPEASSEELRAYKAISHSVCTFTCSNRGRSCSGTGFVARDGDGVYIYTNRHVVIDAESEEVCSFIRAEFIDGTYYNLSPSNARFAADGRDVARFRVSDADWRALTFGNYAPSVNQSVHVYGNSLGRGVITEAKGCVMGVGSQNIEHNADTVQGNSGSPIMDVNLRVIGIDTYSISEKPNERTVLSDSRYVWKVRKFGVRLNGTHWVML